MKDVIVNKLLDIEKTFGVEILMAVESGSRMWGFHSENSDWDVRFIYRRPLSWYLSVHERRDVIELPVEGDLDINGWDVQKALSLMGVSNPTLFEWLYSPIHYRHAQRFFHEKMLAFTKKYFNPRKAVYHYLHMAKGNFRGYLQGDEVKLKKYLYVVRPLLTCQVILEKSVIPPVDFEELLGAVKGYPEAEVRDLLQRKRAGEELALGPKIEALDAWIKDALLRFDLLARDTNRNSEALDDLNEFFYFMATGYKQVSAERQIVF